VPAKQVFFVCGDVTEVLHPFSLLPLMLRRAHLWTSRLAVYEPVVPWRIWVLSMKLPEFLQTAYRKVVRRFFRPVFAFRIVELFDEVENLLVISPAPLDRGHNFLHIVFLALFVSSTSWSTFDGSGGARCSLVR